MAHSVWPFGIIKNSFNFAAPREHHELNPFGNPNSFAQNGSEAYGQESTSFTGDYDHGYQQSANYMNRYVCEEVARNRHTLNPTNIRF